eukprot:TRINITY_DN905_c0_g1_i1.p1 TRINITY_DN905_c0_g1~~TRINITY_DN905_c0_g1_i1.p1  ORF type:complete len:182 (-),score=38.00 TRINITY_DN905_c0_g1_i1:295-798(-)
MLSRLCKAASQRVCCRAVSTLPKRWATASTEQVSAMRAKMKETKPIKPTVSNKGLAGGVPAPKSLSKDASSLSLNSAEDWGFAVEIKDGIAKIIGLDNAFLGEYVVFEQNSGIVLDLQENSCNVMILGDDSFVHAWSLVFRTGMVCGFRVGMDLLGTVVDGRDYFRV